MSILNQWVPIYQSRRLRGKPVALRLDGDEYVLFRNRQGQVAALRNACPHRGMRLSRGKIEGEHLVCPYHGWRFGCTGSGWSAGNPRLPVSAEHLETREHYQLIWVKRPGTRANLPELDDTEFSYYHNATYRVSASRELLVDNFTEVEHTGVAHWQFGYDADAMEDVENVTEVGDDWVGVSTRGRQKPLPWVTRRALGFHSGDILRCRWKTYFEPLWSCWEWWWEDPVSGEPRPKRFRAAAYFLRVSDHESMLTTIYFRTHSPSRFSLMRGIDPFVKWSVNYEVRCDIWLVENIADDHPDFRGWRLGRFDRALYEQRKRLQTLNQSNSDDSAMPVDDVP